MSRALDFHTADCSPTPGVIVYDVDSEEEMAFFPIGPDSIDEAEVKAIAFIDTDRLAASDG